MYKVADMLDRPFPHDLAMMLATGLKNVQPEIHMVSPDTQSFDQPTKAIRGVVNAQHPPLAAVKELLPFEDAINPKTAHERMKAELEALASVDHPALLKVFGSDMNQNQSWFAMEYFANGPMSTKLGRFKGQVLEALKGFRPVVDAVSELHKKKIVHRDIKPDNVFVAHDGPLILGDCGLAIKMEKQNRLTLTYENAGSRDWMPGWAMGMRLEDVRPTFDVFGLGKMLWPMVSGKPKLRLWYHERKEFSLSELFPGNTDVAWVTRLLKKTVVEEEDDCLPSAAELLDEVDKSIQALSAGAVVPTTTGKMRCRFCGIGFYKKADSFKAFGNDPGGWTRHFYYCDNCGHLEVFVDAESKTPLAWSE